MVFIIVFFGTTLRAEKISLSNLSTYLESIKKVSGSFTQFNRDKTVSTGNNLAEDSFNPLSVIWVVLSDMFC